MGKELDHIDDAALARLAAEGDQKAFAKLVDRHRPGVLRIVARYCRDPSGMEDLAQEVFVKAYLNLGALRNGAVFKSWLHRITANTCIDWLRHNKSESDVVEDALAETLPDESYQARADARDARRRLQAAMAVLGPRDQHLLVLLGIEGKTVEEVADLTGLSRVNVKVRAFRARRKLRAVLEKDPA